MASKATKRASTVTPPVTPSKLVGRKPTIAAYIHVGDPKWATENPDHQYGSLTLWSGDDSDSVGIDRYEYIYLKRQLAKLRGIEFTAESEVMDQALTGETVVDVDEPEATSGS